MSKTKEIGMLEILATMHSACSIGEKINVYKQTLHKYNKKKAHNIKYKEPSTKK